MTEIAKQLGELLEKYEKKSGAVIMIEVPAETYFEANSDSLKLLTDKGYEGVYISFQRPFGNVDLLLKQQKVNTNKLLFIDAATALAEEKQEKNQRCVHISQEIDIDELVRAVYTSIEKLKSKNRFIFIDSLTTIALYKPLSEVIRFCEFLMRTVKEQESGEQDILILNVARDLAQKKFIKDIALHVDEVISTK